MNGADVAKELASGGAYTAWFIVVALAGVVAYLYRAVQKAQDRLVEAYKEEDGEVLKSLANVVKTQMEHTVVLTTVLRILEGRK